MSMPQERQPRRLSVAAWCAMAREGAAPPVTICLAGDSMHPLIRKGRDPVTIIPLKRALKKGEMVLFTLGDGLYVVHRVWKLRGDAVRTLGDHAMNPEPWFPQQQVLGLVTCFRRGGRSYRLDTPLTRGCGRCWMLLYPLRRLGWYARWAAGRCMRMLKRTGKTGT